MRVGRSSLGSTSTSPSLRISDDLPHHGHEATNGSLMSIIACSRNKLTRGNLHASQQQLVQERDHKGKGSVHKEDSQRKKLTDAALSLGITLSPCMMNELMQRYDGMMPLERFMVEIDSLEVFLVDEVLGSARDGFTTYEEERTEKDDVCQL